MIIKSVTIPNKLLYPITRVLPVKGARYQINVIVTSPRKGLSVALTPSPRFKCTNRASRIAT